MIGDSGFSSVIMAYDCLLDAKDNWETLIIYSALHWGDSDTVGSIACALYGAMYGFKNVPDGNLKHLEFKNELYEIGKKLFKTFYKNNLILIPLSDKKVVRPIADLG